jgi:hypothetical protein
MRRDTIMMLVLSILATIWAEEANRQTVMLTAGEYADLPAAFLQIKICIITSEPNLEC